MSTRMVSETFIVDEAWRSWDSCARMVALMDERRETVPGWLRYEPASRWRSFMQLLREMEDDRNRPFDPEDCPF